MTGQRVRIVGDHPHIGKSGTVTGSKMVGGGPMLLIDLDHGDYSGQRCYADRRNVRSLHRDEDPEVRRV